MPRLDHCDADLVVLGGQAARHLPRLPTRAKKCQQLRGWQYDMNNVTLSMFVRPFVRSVFLELPFLSTAGDINSYLGLLTFLLFGLI